MTVKICLFYITFAVIVIRLYFSSNLVWSVAVGSLYGIVIHSKNQVTNMDDVCKLFDFVVLRVFNFYVLFVLCVCFFCVDLVFKWFFYCCLCANKDMMTMMMMISMNMWLICRWDVVCYEYTDVQVRCCMLWVPRCAGEVLYVMSTPMCRCGVVCYEYTDVQVKCCMLWVPRCAGEVLYVMSTPMCRCGVVCYELSLIHIWRCRRSTLCRSRWSPYH